MKIAINSYFLGKPSLGFGRYTKNLLDNIREFGTPDDITLLYPGSLPNDVSEEYGDFRILESMETDRFLWAANLPRLFYT